MSKVHNRKAGTRKGEIVIVKNYEDLATVLGAYRATEESISRSVYKGTSCGAWAKLEESIPTGKRERQNWRVIITKVGDRFRAITARQEQGGEWEPRQPWVKRELWSKDLVDVVGWDAGLDEQGYILDEEIVDYLATEVEWGNFGLPVGQKYFEVSFDAYSGGYAPGVSFGSIVEGVDAYAQVQTVAFPCEEKEVWDALQAVEDEAAWIWDETHGCPSCWGGEEVEGEMGGRMVDPECPVCKGHGTII